MTSSTPTEPAQIVQIEQAWRAGDKAAAFSLANAALEAGVEHPVVLRIAAESRIDQERYPDAGDLINRSLAFNPADPDGLCTLGLLLNREGRLDECLNVFGQVLNIDPDHARSWLWLGHTLAVLDVDAEAIKAYTRGGEVAPADPAPLGGIAEVEFRAGRTVEARDAAERALAIDPTHPISSWVAGRMDLAAGDAEKARARMEAVLQRPRLETTERQLSYSLLGDALDRLDRVDDAYAAYTTMNEVMVAHAGPRFGPGGQVESHLNFINRLDAGYRAAGDKAWRVSPPQIAPSPVRRHIFVFGYPRSGNTLAAAVLGALPNVRVTEERATLLDADWAFLRDEAALANLADLSSEEAEFHRDVYWRHVRQTAPDVDGKIYIDMAPLNGLKLPMIRKLFPDARLILCRRDPRDVVLSCFRQTFRVNASTFQMATIRDTANHYAAAMALLQANLTRTAAPVFDLDYETFVADFEANARAMVAFAGLDWNDAALNFSKAAAERKLRTASAAQVRSGLYDGSGQWKRYADYLAPVLPVLAPWIG